MLNSGAQPAREEQMAFDKAPVTRIRPLLAVTGGGVEKMLAGLAFLAGGHMSLGADGCAPIVRIDPAAPSVARDVQVGAAGSRTTPGACRDAIER